MKMSETDAKFNRELMDFLNEKLEGAPFYCIVSLKKEKHVTLPDGRKVRPDGFYCVTNMKVETTPFLVFRDVMKNAKERMDMFYNAFFVVQSQPMPGKEGGGKFSEYR